MFIKSVKISGFRHFGETVVFNNFSNKTNCILGLNGTGKSTFFFAIDFVLLDKYAILTPQQRAGLLHAGSLHSQQAFVEILFNNNPRQVPIDKDEFTIRRAISLSKDEIFINKTHSTRQDVTNLFSAIDISLKNSIFSIGQGEVKRILQMNDRDRLLLLNSICGVEGFHDRIVESEKLMTEAEANKSRIEKSLEYIKDQIDSLEEERQALEEYNKIERKRKAVEFLIYDRKYQEAKSEIESVENQRSDSNTILDGLKLEHVEITKNINQIKKDIGDSLNLQSDYKTQLESMENKKNDLLKKITNAQLKVERAEVKIANAKDSDMRLKDEIAQIAEKVNNLDEERQNMKKDLNQANAEIGALEALSSNVKNKNDAKNIAKEISQLEKELKTKKQEITYYTQNIEAISQVLEQKQEDTQSLNENIRKAKEDININLVTKLNEIKAARKEKMNERKEIWVNQSQIDKKEKQILEQYNEAKRRYEHRIGESTFRAIDYVKNTLKMEKIHGPLIDMINITREGITDAIDAVASRHLFSMIAEDDEAAKKLTESLKDGRHGKLSFIVLSRLKFTPKEIPRTNQMTPLLDYIEYENEMIKPVVDYVFNGFGLCATLSDANDSSVQNKCTTVTMSGDIVTYGGVMVGGYRNPSHSITGLYQTQKQLTIQLENNREMKKNCEDQLKDLESELKALDNEWNEIDRAITDRKREINEMADRITTKQNEIESLLNQKNIFENRKDSVDNEYIRLSNKFEELQKMQQENGLNNEKIDDTSDALTDLLTKKYQIEENVKDITTKIENLTKQMNEKKRIYVDVESELLMKQKHEEIVEKSTEQCKDLQSKIEELEQQVYSEKQENDERITQMSQLKQRQESIQSRIDHERKAIEHLTAQTLLLTERRDSASEKLSSIAPYPQEEIDEFQDYRTSDLLQVLGDINSELNDFRHLNKKADMQYQSFVDQQQRLFDRMEEIERSHQSLSDLKQSLVEKKHVAFEVFFSKVSQAFKDIYSQLTGSTEERNVAQLVLQGPVDYIEGQQETIEPTGIEIHAPESQNEIIEGRSGGQRTILSLCLIFALQQVVPSPFYFFDEIDSDLDPENRAVLSAFIETLSNTENSPQFFFSTFRPELIPISKRIIGLKLRNPDKSDLYDLSEGEAEEFIQIDQQEE